MPHPQALYQSLGFQWYIYIFFCNFWLSIPIAIFIPNYLYFESTQNLAEGGWIVMEEWFAHVIKILRGKIDEPIELILFYLLENVLVIERTIKLRFCFASSHRGPLLSFYQRLYKVKLSATIKAAKSFEFLRKIYFDLVFDLRNF